MPENEKQFESNIEQYLISPAGGFEKATDATYDPAMALDILTLVKFVRTTQPLVWQRFERQCGSDPYKKFYKCLEDAVQADGLQAAVLSAVRDLPETSVVRLTVTGTAPGGEYAEKQKIYDEALRRFLTYEVADAGLSERITPEQIRAEFAEIGFAAQLLEALTDPKEIQMAYELIKKYRM